MDGRAGRRMQVLAAALLCAALYSWPIAWGLPSEYGWAPDELTPAVVLEAAAHRFSGGWHSKYPAFHHALLTVAYAPWLSAPAGPERTYRLFLAGRALSLLMAVGMVVLVYRCGRERMDHGPALFAALVAGLCAPMAYYAKTANLEAPYLFWFAAALLFYLRVLRRHRRNDYEWLGACVAAAVATKDQAYALFLPMPPAILWSLSRQRAAEGRSPSLLATLTDRRVLTAAAVAVLGVLALDNVVLNPSGFTAHIRLITGAASRDFRMYEPTPAGLFALAVATGRAILFAMGAPAMIAAVAGIPVALRRREQSMLMTSLPALSYWLAFVAVVLYVYDRFVLPMALVLALFAGRALAEALPKRRGWAIAAAALVAGHCALRALSVDVLMARDSRYAAERWLKANAAPPALVAAEGPLEDLPRLDGLQWRRMGPSLDRLRRIDPDVVVLNGDFARRAVPGGSDAELYAALASGAAGYRLAFTAPPPETLPFLDPAAFRGDAPSRVYSNLDTVGPTILVYARTPAPR
jgi:hypothetical protein